MVLTKERPKFPLLPPPNTVKGTGGWASTARVQRGESSTARCASTEARPPVPFLRQNHIQCLPHLTNPNQFNPIDGLQLGQVPFRQQTAFESHLCRFTNPHL